MHCTSVVLCCQLGSAVYKTFLRDPICERKQGEGRNGQREKPSYGAETPKLQWQELRSQCHPSQCPKSGRRSQIRVPLPQQSNGSQARHLSAVEAGTGRADIWRLFANFPLHCWGASPVLKRDLGNASPRPPHLHTHMCSWEFRAPLNC